MNEQRDDDFGSRIARIEAQIVGLKELVDSQRKDDQLALSKALASADKLADKHNDLIRAAQDRDAHYAAKADIERVEEEVRRLRAGAVPLALYDEKHDALAEKVNVIDKWKSNVTGRYVGISLIGAIFTASTAAIIVHLAGGG